MMPMASAATFALIAFAVSWTLWFAVAATPQLAFNPIFYLPGTIAPGLVALALTKFKGGSAALSSLLNRIFAWRANWRWYAFAVLFMATVKLGAAIAHRAITGEWPQFGDVAPLIMLAAVLVSTPVQAGEELGWRGFMLPALAERIGLASASLLVGVVWALWHLPMFFIAAGDLVGQSLWVYLLGVTALSVAMTWLFANTGGSLLLVMIMHAAVNNTTGLVPATRPGGAADVFGLDATPMGWLTIVVLWVFAIYFLVRMRGMHAKQRPDGPVGVPGQRESAV
jgi:membrane protease YdiL (CAAX protease family)